MKSNRGIGLPIALPVACAAALGCFTSSAVRPGELRRLDGYRGTGAATPTPELETISGERVAFTRSSDLYLGLPGVEGEVGGQFASIRVRDGMFEGVTTRGQTIEAPVERVEEARIETLNAPLTAAIVGGALVAAGLLGAFVVLARDQPEGSVGRALRLRRRATFAAPVAQDGWFTDLAAPNASRLAPEARATLASAWLAAARGEHASVPAFARLSLTLVALGAPARLVERAHRAALEEIQHARLSFALASAYLGEPVSPGTLAELQDARAVTATTLRQLAEESLVEGCLLEGAAAAVAEAALARTSDPAVRSALAIIARDEASHVELAWQIVRWCCDESGPTLADHLRALAGRPRTVKPPFDVPGELTPELAAHGCADGATWQAAYEGTQAMVVARLDEYRRGFRG